VCFVILQNMHGLSKTLKEASKHQENAILLCSFQKEESVLLHSLLQFAPQTKVATIDTGVLFPETEQAQQDFETYFDLKITSYPAYGNWTGPEECCGIKKVAALEKAISGKEAWITGLRREQGPSRANIELVEYDETRQLTKYNPLAFWSEKELWSYINEHDLPYHKLHDQGYSSIGCSVCTMPGSGREGRWAGTDKEECGIHVIQSIS
jgi:phosphoadenosine phosphosulfate reductase